MPTGKNIFERRPLPPDTRKGRGSFAKAAGSYVPKIAAKVFEKYGFHSAEIMTEWGRVAGPEFASFTAPEKIRWPRGGTDTAASEPRPGATLHLRVEPARALDAEYRGAEIIERINRYFGYRAVEQLRLIQAPLRQNAITGATTLHEPHHKPAQEHESERVGARDYAVPETVADPGLKAALLTLWASVSGASAKD